MKVTFLGTGTSMGVPEIGCQCETCRSNDPHDSRLRASLLVKENGVVILIDCGPDFRIQALKYGISQIDGLLLTHEHYDHIGGLDDLRPFSWLKNVEVYAEKQVTKVVHERIPYVFRENKYPGVPNLHLNEIDLSPFEIKGVRIQPIRLMHAALPILGYRIGDMAYLTDVKTIPDSEFEKLKNLKLLIIDGLRYEPHMSHTSVSEAIAYINRINPKCAYLTHMSHRIGLHAQASVKLPPNIYYAFDGLNVDI